MTQNRVVTTDREIISVLEDAPGSIAVYNRLLNGRAPVSLKLNGIAKGQSDILNFILASNATITGSSAQLDIEIPTNVVSFIFRPGGVAGGNIYTDIVALYTDLSSIDGPTRLIIDTSISAASLAAVAYDFSNTILEGLEQPKYPFSGGTNTILSVPIGCTFTGGRFFIKGLTVRALTTAPVMSNATGGLIVLQEGSVLESAGSASFIVNTSSTPTRLILEKSKIITGVSNIFEQNTGTGTNSEVYLFGGSEVEDDTLASAPTDTMTSYIYSTGCIVSTTHSSLSVPLVVSLATNSRLERFDPTVIGLLTKSNVQEAIDELTGLIGGGGGLIPKKDFFLPSLGQTVFVLTSVPNPLSTFTVSVNGVEYPNPASFSTFATTLTWTDVPFILTPPDELIVHYQV